MKKIMLVVFAVLLLTSCTSTISKEKYIDVMSTLGCKLAMENTPEGDAVYKEMGVTEYDIQKFRKDMKPSEVKEISVGIAKRVAECHGVKE